MIFSLKTKWAMPGKLWCGFLALAMLVVGAAQLQADDTYNLTAGADLRNVEGTVTLNIAYKSISNPSLTPNTIRWEIVQTDDSSVNPSEKVVFATNGQLKSAWVRADTYIVVETQISDIRGVIQIYTDNKNPTDVNGHARTPYTGDENPAGIYPPSNPKATPLPLSWRITDIATHTVEADKIVGGVITPGFKPALSVKRGFRLEECPGTKPEDVLRPQDRLWVQEIGPCFPAFLYMIDRNTPDTNPNTPQKEPFELGLSYMRLKDATHGLQIAEGTFAYGPSPDYLYFAADFTGAAAQQNYTANIILEKFLE